MDRISFTRTDQNMSEYMCRFQLVVICTAVTAPNGLITLGSKKLTTKTNCVQ